MVNYQSHLPVCSHICFCMLNPQMCWVPDTSHWTVEYGGVCWAVIEGLWVSHDVWYMAGGRWPIMAAIMMSVDIIVWTWYLQWPPWQDLTMPYGHGIRKCSLEPCKNSGQLNHHNCRIVDAESPMNLLSTSSHWWLVYVCKLGPWLLVMNTIANGNGNWDGIANGVGDSEHITRSAKMGSFATSISVSKLLLIQRYLLARNIWYISLAPFQGETATRLCHSTSIAN